MHSWKMRALLYNMFILLRDRFLWKSGLYLRLGSIQLSIKRMEHKSDYNRYTNYLIQNSCLCKSQDAIKVFIHATCCVCIYIYILCEVVDIDRLFRRIGEMRESIFEPQPHLPRELCVFINRLGSGFPRLYRTTSPAQTCWARHIYSKKGSRRVAISFSL